MPPLDRTITLAERDHVAVIVAKNLYFDVSRMREILLDENSSVAEGRALFAQFHARATGGEPAAPLSEPLAEEMDRLEPLTGVKAFPARVKCATLSWHALEAALKGGIGTPVKTE